MISIEKKPEILSPAGDMESLKSAILFGADAVYVGAESFGMRSAAAKFDQDILPAAVEYAHEHGVRLYLTCNILPKNNEIDALPDFIKRTSSYGIDAFIVSDFGVMELVKRYAPDTEIHISTQAGVTNYLTAKLLHEMGAKRIIPARELSLEELKQIISRCPEDMETECFVHGAMCVSFSGRCLLSSYLTGRDSNRGECAQPCRWKYNLVEETRPGQFFPIDDSNDGTYILNSKDMCLLPYIAQLAEAGISSLKIEGRAKSAYYTAVVTNAYRCALDAYFESQRSDYVPEDWILDEVKKVSHREYCSGFFFESPNEDAKIFYDGCYRRYCEFVGVAVDCEDGFLIAEQRNKFFAGDVLEVLEPSKKPYELKTDELFDEDNRPIESTPHPQMRFKIRTDKIISPGSLIRKVYDSSAVI